MTNTVTAVKNAQMAESPVLLLGGAAATLLKVDVQKLNLYFFYSLKLVKSCIIEAVLRNVLLGKLLLLKFWILRIWQKVMRAD